MYRLLIVDDEPAIREGLKTLIDWRKQGFELCGEAANGRQGAEMCLALRPDAVLADIRMPGRSGLDMLADAREAGLTCRFVLLTGYSDFQYAQQAIEQGVSAYLLKPIDPEELAERMGKLRAELDKERRIIARAEEGEAQEREALLLRLATDKGAALDPEIMRRGEELLGLPWRRSRLLLVAIDGRKADAVAGIALKELLRGAAAEREGVHALPVEEFVLMVLGDGVTAASVKPLIRSVVELFEAQGGRIAVYAGPLLASSSEWAATCAQLLRLARNPFVSRSGAGFWIDVRESGAQPANDAAGETVAGRSEAGHATAAPRRQTFDAESLAQRLALAVGSGQADTLRAAAEEAVRLIASESEAELAIKMRIAMVDMALRRRLTASYGELADAPDAPAGDSADWGRHETLDALLEAFAGRLERWAVALRRSRPDATLQGMLEFIRANCDQELKLELLAELYHYNSGYLGKLFRQQTGEYFNTYLDRVRMDRAKALLAQGHKVGKVAEMVGYANVEYFNGKFRKYVGMPPSRYKRETGAD
ncbi:response regulator [Cohnella sp. JJ-181]|uniref:response regulator n=1 Tax=Cohnella rhizoplanae TaxID=2974897 RepID=UPI0022FF7A0D|nr:response regulator [Cohnella sp. JJ-181]CAI6086976.1 HTH-type transcriptional activator RhaR [Cohnella sp. JJ-181]